jgi:hypothetical protein
MSDVDDFPDDVPAPDLDEDENFPEEDEDGSSQGSPS